jgi:DNA-directed RNA polymerase subunit RPC12/RpoP
MAKKNLKDNILKVKCANCKKPFHFTPQAESNEPGDVEMALDCPFCQTQLIVKVPRRLGERETMLRGSAPRELLTSRKAEQ